jgi:hypothetical protein
MPGCRVSSAEPGLPLRAIIVDVPLARRRALALACAVATSVACSRDHGSASTPAPAPRASDAAAAASLAPPPVAPPVAPQADTPGACAHVGRGRDFPVGPGQKYASLGEVPFESLGAGDTVRVYFREEPYREKLMIHGKGTETDPIRICGVPGPDGRLPVIDGKDATTRRQLDFPFDGHQVRGLVIIGHAHGEPWESTPTHIVFEGFEVRNGAPPYTFTDRSGKAAAYSSIAAGIFVERADHLTIRGCTVTGNNNGLFVGTGGGAVELTRNVLIEKNWIHGNGSLVDWYEHNVYNEASDVVYQYNRFGPPRSGARGVLGANIKERSAGVVIRYNWIEDGAHILDIVDAQESKEVTRAMPSFHVTYVYGNVILRGATPSGSMIHYGGDSGVLGDYRKGKLLFYENTVFVKNARYPEYTRTPIFELSTNEEQLDSRDNVYASEVAPDDLHALGMLGERNRVSSGVATFAGDWVRKGITAHELTRLVYLRAKVSGLDDKVTRGDDPGFLDAREGGFTLVAPLGQPVALRPDIPPELLPTAQYVPHQRGRPRSDAPALGAFGE